jgi:23S rRNA-/tRNA-specific pseudouridylate synthase
MTSGIVVMAKTKESAKQFQNLLHEKNVIKKYIARVKGQFPYEEIIVNQPILKKKNFAEIDLKGKPSETIFKLIQTNGKESIVECQPLTGRMHQIRIHLSFLGYPISNDFVYKGEKQNLSNEEIDELKKAKELGLHSLDYENGKSNFMIYLHSFHYQCEHFNFHIELPCWANLIN